MNIPMIKNIKRTTLLGVITSAICISSSANADQLNSNNSNGVSFNHTQSIASVSKPKIFIVEQSLPDFLRQAARRNGYQITMTPRVRGTLKKMSLPLNIEKMLEKIAPQFDLKWHFQQKQLYISTGSENSTRMIFLGDTEMDDLEQALKGAGLNSKAYDLTFVEESNSVIVNGPVSFIASVELITEALGKNKTIQKDKLKIIRFGTVSKN